MRAIPLLSCVLSALLVTACGDAESAEHQRKHSIPAGIFDRLAGGASRRARRSYWWMHPCSGANTRPRWGTTPAGALIPADNWNHPHKTLVAW